MGGIVILFAGAVFAGRARVRLDGCNLHLGYYDSREEAQEAHSSAVKAHLGKAYLKAEDRP
jgi:hypothetical protein